jgi:hypothetical protein
LSKKSIALLSIIILLPIIIYFLWPSDESRIKKLFKEGAGAMEQEDIDKVMAKVSYNYSDEYGLTYLYLKESLKRVLQQMKDIKIEYENMQVKINEEKATADMDVRIIATIGNDTGYILGDLPKPAHLTFTLEKERTKWLITRTEGLPVNW